MANSVKDNNFQCIVETVNSIVLEKELQPSKKVTKYIKNIFVGDESFKISNIKLLRKKF